MRAAILSDIHGNLIALDALLADVERAGGADEYWVLGDLAAIGYDPAGVLERLTTLPNLRVIRGNADRYVTTGARPQPSMQEAQANPALLPVLVEVAHSFAWTQGVLTASGWLDWLDALPLELRVTLPDGTRFLGVHASPGRDDGGGLHPGLSAEEQATLLDGSEADLICVGHTHYAMDAQVGTTRVVNLGSVSNPWASDLRAGYALLEADRAGYRLDRRRVDYDRDAVVQALERVRHPARAYIARHLTGQLHSRWDTAT